MSQAKRTRQIRKTNSGITLLEVMVSLAIIAMVAALVAPRVIGSFGRAKSQTAQVQLANVKGALQLYYLDIGQYPAETEGLNNLLEKPDGIAGWDGPYVESLDELKDPWGRMILYAFPVQDGGFDLSTYGRDGQPGGTKEDKDLKL
jgi:general secretion pathway protein G